jgi:hypothetical protein
MFDVVQIVWWFVQVSLVGYLCTSRIFDNENDRLLFAPVVGLAGLLVVGNLIWMWSIPTYVTSYILALTVGAAIVLVWRVESRPSSPSWAWLAAGVLLLAMSGSLIPFSEKLWQAYPLDRFGFLISSILFQQERLSYFTDAIARLSQSADQQALFLHPMITAAFGEMQARAASEVAFAAITWLTPNDMHRLGNAWEVFLRTLQFASVFALFSKGLAGRFLPGFLAVSAAFGYWFQYLKDFNSWPHMATTALVLAIVALLVSCLNKGQVNSKERYLIYFLALAMIVNHAEFALVLCLGLGVVVCCNEVLRREYLFRRATVFDLAGLLALVFLVHPYIAAWIKHMFLMSPAMIGGATYQAKGIYALFADSDAKYVGYVVSVVEYPLRLLVDPVALADIAIGTTGFSFVSYVGSAVTLGATFLLIALCGIWLRGQEFGSVSRLFRRPMVIPGLAIAGAITILLGLVLPGALRSNVTNAAASLLLGGILFALLVFGAVFTKRPSLRILFVLTLFQFVFFVGSLIADSIFGILGAGSAYRSLPYWGVFASLALTLLLASTEIEAFKLIAVGFAVLNLIFGMSFVWVANRGGIETYPKYYLNTTGVRHFLKPTVRDKYDFDYLDLVDPLARCNLVLLNFEETEPRGVGRFQSANLMLFLENNHIRFKLGFPYLNAYQLLGNAYYPGFKKEDAGADCIVSQELRNGRISYKLTTQEWR